MSHRSITTSWFIFLGCLGALLSMLGSFGHVHLIFDLLSNFRIQYLVGILIVGAVAVKSKSYFAVILLLTAFVIHGREITGAYFPLPDPPSASTDSVRAMTSNLLLTNTDYAAHIEYIGSIDPDVIVFQEYTLSWHRALSDSLARYSYRISEPRNSPFGIAIYSKYAFQNKEVILLHDSSSPSIDVVVDFDWGPLRILGTHPRPPLSTQMFADRNSQLQEIARIASLESAPMLVVGDLNITPWSVHFKDLLRHGRLEDVRRGFGVLATWPSTFLPVQIPIDYILTSNGISATNVETSQRLGSDHKSLWADLIVNR